MVKKVNVHVLESWVGGRDIGRLRRIAKQKGGLTRAFRAVFAAGLEAVERERDDRYLPDPVATSPSEPRYSHISGLGE